jgi:hypothetical protein
MRKGKHCNLKVRSVYLLVILKMSKVIEFFNHIVMKLLLEEMLNFMKISWPASLIRRLCLLRPVSHLWCLCLLLFIFWFLLQMMTVRMKIYLCLLTFLQMSPLNLNQHQLHNFLDGSVQHEKQLDLDLGAKRIDYRLNTINIEIGRITQIFNEQYLLLINEIG